MLLYQKLKSFYLVVLLSLGSLNASTLDELNQYIQSRTEQTDSIEQFAHCGFTLQYELQQRLHELEPEFQTLAKILLTEPERHKSVLSPAGHFTLNFDTSGYNMVPLEDLSGNGIPDYVDSAAVFFDHVWQVEINEMNFAAPPDMDGEPRKPYPVYFTKFGFYGQTSFNTEEDIPSLNGFNYTSYIEIHANYFSTGYYTSGYEAMKVTAAHEFNHAVQLGYNFRSSDIYFMEMTSTWLEDFVYNEVDDYLQYLPRYFQNIFYKRFNITDGNSEYAASLYLHMLEHEHGWQAIPEIWRGTRDEDALHALNEYLNDEGSSFAKSQINYATWLYFTGNRTQQGVFFPEAQAYPTINPKLGISEVIKDLNGLSMRQVQIIPDSSLVYLANLESSGGQGVFNHLNNGQYSQEAHMFGSAQVFSQDSNKPLVLVMTNPNSETIEDIRYTLIENPDQANLKIYTHQTNEGLRFFNIPVQSTLSIYSLNGRPLQKIEVGSIETGQVDWDAKERSGNKLSTGVYLFYVHGMGKPYLGKFTFVQK